MMEFSVEESAAIKALGPLFNLTEVHLWDDGSIEVQEESYFREPTKFTDLDHDGGAFDSTTINELQGDMLEVPPSISKYWCQRYLLVSRFDDGIKMDEEGWFSVTHESIAKHIAIRCSSGTIVDLFAGVGGNVIQFAQRSKHVVAIDIDPLKIEYARHNASLYGVDDKIDFISADSFSLAPKLKADTVFMSPPWGGPDYAKVNEFDINTMLKPHDGQHLFDIGRKIAPKIVMFLPKNVDLNQLAELSLSTSPPWSLQVEKNFLNERLIAVTAYFCEPSEI